MVAASKGHMWGRNINDTIKLLLAHGANIEAVDNGEKGFKRAIHLAAQYGGYEQATDVIETLIKVRLMTFPFLLCLTSRARLALISRPNRTISGGRSTTRPFLDIRALSRRLSTREPTSEP